MSTQIMYELSDQIGYAADWFEDLLPALGGLLLAAGAIYLAFIGWRAFKAASGKV